MNEKIACHNCGSLNCRIRDRRVYLNNIEVLCQITCRDCKIDFYDERKKFKDMKEYDYE
jgi:hypothetical protein